MREKQRSKDRGNRLHKDFTVFRMEKFCSAQIFNDTMTELNHKVSGSGETRMKEKKVDKIEA